MAEPAVLAGPGTRHGHRGTMNQAHGRRRCPLEGGLDGLTGGAGMAPRARQDRSSAPDPPTFPATGAGCPARSGLYLWSQGHS